MFRVFGAVLSLHTSWVWRAHAADPLHAENSSVIGGSAWRVGTAKETAAGWTVVRSAAPREVDSDILNNRHIVFFGDSISRQQGMSLVRYLSTGKWVTPDPTGPRSRNEKMESSALRTALTISDCAPNPVNYSASGSQRRLFLGNLADNNHWWVRKCSSLRTASAGTRVTFISFKTFPVVWQDEEASGVRECLVLPYAASLKRKSVPRQQCTAFKRCMQRHPRDKFCRPNFRKTLAPPDALDRVITSLDPDVIVINTGLWGDVTDASELSAFTSTIKNALQLRQLSSSRPPLRIIWKTTAIGTKYAFPPCDCTLARAVLQGGAEYFDAAAFTAGLADGGALQKVAYYDDWHFDPAVYAAINIAFIDHLDRGWRGLPLPAVPPCFTTPHSSATVSV
jgi:hypothetical protein